MSGRELAATLLSLSNTVVVMAARHWWMSTRNLFSAIGVAIYGYLTLFHLWIMGRL